MDDYSNDSYEKECYELEEAVVETASSSSGAKVINKDSFLAVQREDLQRVMNVMPLKEHHARTLLIHFHWNIERRALSDFAKRVSDLPFSSGQSWRSQTLRRHAAHDLGKYCEGHGLAPVLEDGREASLVTNSRISLFKGCMSV